MSNQFTVSQFVSAPVEDVFRYMTEPELIEKWSWNFFYFEDKPGGKYQYEDSNQDGEFTAKGHIEDIIPNKKIVMIDDEITGPKGVLYNNLKCLISLEHQAMGTNVVITQSGFHDEKSLSDREKRWNECLTRLSQLFGKSVGGNFSPWDESYGSIS